VISVTDTTTNNIGTINPFRYRSYYYDEETKLYYLNSRYYNPEWCRFINADSIIGANQDILSLNLYAYVSNNPVNNYDKNGTFIKKVWSKVKKAAKNIYSGGEKVLNYGKKLIVGVYKTGKAIVKELYKAFDFEIGLSDSKNSYSVGGLPGIPLNVGKYEDHTIKLNEGKFSCSYDNIKSIQNISVSESEDDLCPWQDGVKVEKTNSKSISISKFELSTEGLFIGESLNLHVPGVGLSVRIGFYFVWDVVE